MLAEVVFDSFPQSISGRCRVRARRYGKCFHNITRSAGRRHEHREPSLFPDLARTYYSADRRGFYIFVENAVVDHCRFRNVGNEVFLGHLPVSRIVRTEGPSSIETTFVLEVIESLASTCITRPGPCGLPWTLKRVDAREADKVRSVPSPAT